MRVRELAASEWGNSTYYPSSGGGRGGGGVLREGGHIPHYVRVSQELSLIF